MRLRIPRVMRSLAAAALCGSLALVAVPTHSGALTVPTTFVTLRGEGAWSMTGELVPWQNELESASSPINLNYTPNGSLLGRQDLALKQDDFAITGVPWQPGELDKVKGGASAFISAPVQVSTLVTYIEPTFQRPVPSFKTFKQICDPDDPTTWPPVGAKRPTDCFVRAAFTGPVHIPNENLAAMYLHYDGTGDLPLYAWNNADVLTAFGLNPATDAIDLADDGNPAIGPGVALRADGDETNYFIQQYVKAVAPDIWNGEVQSGAGIVQWEPISERIPIVPTFGATRDGAEQQIELMASGGCGVGGGSCPNANSPSGGVAGAPPSMLARFQSTFPGAPLLEAQMQNANGDWVPPTPESIDKAVAAGGETPLFALTNKVPGAYPLVWVDRLYAPAHGLSIAKTEGIAMLIRYLATSGQSKEAAVGDGQLTSDLANQALQAANALVTSNCTGSDRHIVSSSDPGPLAPASATAMKSIGTMLHCEPVAAATTTTTTFSSAGNTGSDNFGGGSSFTSNDGSSSLSSASGTGASNSGYSSGDTGSSSSGGSTGSGGGSSSSSASSGSGNALLVASQLPLTQPGGASGTDRLATFLLGAFLYLLFRKPIGRLFNRIAAKV